MSMELASAGAGHKAGCSISAYLWTKLHLEPGNCSASCSWSCPISASLKLQHACAIAHYGVLFWHDSPAAMIFQPGT